MATMSRHARADECKCGSADVDVATDPRYTFECQDCGRKWNPRAIAGKSKRHAAAARNQPERGVKGSAKPRRFNTNTGVEHHFDCECGNCTPRTHGPECDCSICTLNYGAVGSVTRFFANR